VTRPTTVAVDAQLDRDVLVVVGSTDVSFADFGVTPPSASGVAGADDHGTLELQLYFTRN
jgi:hypothetical protein